MTLPEKSPCQSSSQASSLNSFGAASSSSAGPTPLALAHHDSLVWAPSSSNQKSNLRHLTEYERIRTLGRGAFGTTHLVKNLVDSRLYALKCIRLDESVGETSRVLREVEALSALKSDYVVRYYGAWVERGELEGDSNGSGTGDEDSLSNWTDPTASGSGNHSSSQLLCACCHQPYIDWEISYEQWGLIDSVLQPLNLCTECYRKSLPDGVDASKIDIRQKKCQLPECLYILMEYAGKTLNEEIKRLNNDKNDHDEDIDTERWSLFAQCVQGLHSIHEEGYLHR